MNYKEFLKNKFDKAVKKEESGLAGFFIRKYRFTYLIIIAVIVLGSFSLMTLPREAEPEVTIPYAVVTTAFPGSSPSDTEELVTNEIESEIENVDNVKQYQSTSREGLSSIFVEFEASADLDQSMDDLRRAVDEAESFLPEDAETPRVTEISINEIPILTYSLSGDYSDRQLKKYADDLKDELDNISGVSKVEVVGGRGREFQVLADPVKMEHFNITLNEAVNAIQGSNIGLPVGDIEMDGFNYNIRVAGRYEKAEQLGDVVVASYKDSPVYLKEVAEIKDVLKEKQSESHVGYPGTDPQNAISLQVFKKTGANIVDITDEANSLVEKNESGQGELPLDLTIQKTTDESKTVRDSLSTLGMSGLQTFVLIAIILLVILSFRGALITAISIPLAFLITFAVLKSMGMTLNNMVLYALVLGLGLMVDNSIIIIEGINEYVSRHGRNLYEAALLSVWTFKWPIIAGTLTTVSAFVPMLLVSGILGEYLSIIPKTVSTALLSSLFVAIIVIPTLAHRFIKTKQDNGKGQRNKRRHVFVGKQMNKLYVIYRKHLNKILPFRKRRIVLISFLWILFFGAVAVPVSGLMKTQLFPAVDVGYFAVNIELPPGTTLDKTRQVTEKIEEKASRISGLDNYVTNLGQSISLRVGGGGSAGEHLAGIRINLVDEDDRDRASYEVASDFREKVKNISEAEVTVEELSAGPPTGAPVEVRVSGDDIQELTRIGDLITDYFKNREDVVNVGNSIQEATGEIVFTVDKEKAGIYGLDTRTVAQTLRSAIYGIGAGDINITGEEEDVDITVKYQQGELSDINDLKELDIATPAGNTIDVSQVASLSIEPSLLSIAHRDGSRIVTVTADTVTGADLQNIVQEFNQEKESIAKPDNFSIEVGGETEDITASFQELFYSMIVAVILIAAILILQFNSFRQPFIILFTLPLAIIGVVFGLFIMNQPFSFPVFIGLVALSGIVVNDAIVLVDKINRNIDDGLEFYEAIVDGGISRMQPIFLTTLTTIAGVFPLIFANEMWVGMSLAIIFGLLFATLLNLIVLPAFYVSLCRKEKK
jgi:HAE1 family hydrophobic/amphiphilic exporter-1